MRLVDVHTRERERAIFAFAVDDDILVDPDPEFAVANLLEALDGWRPCAIALTHTSNLGHAGGALVETGRSARSRSTSAARATSPRRSG
jgi:hypothetical protein